MLACIYCLLVTTLVSGYLFGVCFGDFVWSLVADLVWEGFPVEFVGLLFV